MRAQIVSFHCVMKNRLGKVLSSSFNQDVINQMEEGCQKLSGLIAGLQDVKEGERRQITVSADRAYGLYDPKLVLEVRRSEMDLGEILEIGSQVLRRVGKSGESKVFYVVHSKGDSVTLDGNHPFAGQDLVFEIEVVSAREAVEEDFGETVLPESSRYLH